ncbi:MULTISPECIES: choline/ethanolamine kinase family protein [Marinomonas]|uniref:Phosphotransferase family protein n=1 Tax=Marinomonas rhodophyticola TaxID=2992803 RepID=A0ABT3KKW7_9GAMM|nr:choline/ethanolamine kinase family protein [Marinomonas sp. KJ51-3]MCW4631203.1 phosphotransferase family protein [Marinomonas sp. KJ51-3]
MTVLSEYFVKMAGILPAITEVEVTLLEEGFSNKVYLIYWHQIPRLVLRIPGLDEFAFNINRQNEMIVLQSAVQAGISPPVLWHDEQGAFACQFVVQPSLSWDVIHSNSSIKRIANALVQAHALPRVNHPFCIYELIAHYLQSIESFLPIRPDIQGELLYLRGVFANLPRVESSYTPVVCHNDLNPKNVLIDEDTIWLIDWEYTGMGDPLFDLAVVARSHNLTFEQQVYLIESYNGSLDKEATLEKITRYSLAYSLREMTWLLLKHLTTPDDPEAWSFYVDFKAMPSLNPFLETVASE